MPGKNSSNADTKRTGCMKKGRTNIGASARAQLLNVARQLNVDYNALLRRYFQERFLYRLSVSEYKDNLILKGALILAGYNISRYRPTKDIDFLGKAIKDDIEDFKKIIAEIASIQNDDGVSFDIKNITAEEIKEEADYKGIKIHLPCSMDTIKNNVSVDIGFGDEIVAGPIEMDFPVILNSAVPKIKVYSLESAIAEKFESIVKLNILTSRMKDFYDILFISSSKSFNSETLKIAINNTFKNRETDLQERTSVYEILKDDRQKKTQWSAFLKKNKLKAENEFRVVINKIQNFIEPIFGLKESKQWNPENWNWE